MAVFTNATSADTPYTPSRLASYRLGSTVTWLVPRGTQGDPLKRNPRKNSVTVHGAAARRSAGAPARATSRDVITANHAGKRPRYSASRSIAQIATGVASPPNCATTVLVQ